jgi:hypothetical protein
METLAEPVDKLYEALWSVAVRNILILLIVETLILLIVETVTS